MKKRVRFLGLLIVVLFSLSGCAAAGGGSLSSEAGGEAAPAPVPAPKLLDVETGALEITGAPLDGLELDFIREEFKDIAALKEREDAAYRRGEAAAPSTLGVLAFSCDLDENGQTDYLAFPVGFGYTATMDQHSTGVFFCSGCGRIPHLFRRSLCRGPFAENLSFREQNRRDARSVLLLSVGGGHRFDLL